MANRRRVPLHRTLRGEMAVGAKISHGNPTLQKIS
jgi:hypothetical protein